jgi:hypothetical protein
MTTVRLAVIVEGHGEAKAVPRLIGRIAKEVTPDVTVISHPIFRVPASRLLKEGGLERQVERAAREVGGRGGLLVLLDCDWEGSCPARDGPVLTRRARAARADVEVSVVLAKKEYEAWFIAAAESLRGQCGLRHDLVADRHPEDVRGAKEWLNRHMPRNRRYAETTDQAAFTSMFDLQAARRADSFDKCYREIVRLLTVLGAAK